MKEKIKYSPLIIEQNKNDEKVNIQMKVEGVYKVKENIEEDIKDLKAVYSGAVQAGELSIANIIKRGIDLIEKLQKENEELKHKYDKALSDLVNAEKENEKLKRLIAHRNGYTQQLEKDLFENCGNYVISKQKVRDEIEYINKFEEDLYKKENIIQVLQDLLEEKGE